MRSLVITADDFGASPEINEAVELAHRDGILTAASLMVAGAAAEDAVERARRLPSLGVGLHVVLVDGRPTLPPHRIPDLVDDRGMFRQEMAMVGLNIAMRSRVREQLRAEIDAQFSAFANTGLPIDHVDAHKHFHVHPVIGRLVLDAAVRHGVPAVRIPYERGVPRGSEWIAAPFVAWLGRRARRRALVVPDRVHGLRDTGRMDTDRVQAVIRSLPDGLNELYLHPAVTDDHPAHAPGYAHRAEFDALRSERCRRAVVARGVRLCRYASFARH